MNERVQAEAGNVDQVCAVAGVLIWPHCAPELRHVVNPRGHCIVCLVHIEI